MSINFLPAALLTHLQNMLRVTSGFGLRSKSRSGGPVLLNVASANVHNKINNNEDLFFFI